MSDWLSRVAGGLRDGVDEADPRDSVGELQLGEQVRRLAAIVTALQGDVAGLREALEVLQEEVAEL